MNNELFPWLKQSKRTCIVVAIIFLVIGIIISLNSSMADPLENDVEVEPESELTYYLNVSYDGVDKNGLQSDNTTVVDIRSGTLLVQDKIPDGLTFTGFLTTANGSIGAIKRGTEESCLGKVVDDNEDSPTDTGVWNEAHTEYNYHGLHYNDQTRTVTFKVKNLQAGCELTVGIKTMTPTIDDPATPEKETRRDFYNFASITERDFTVLSNTVHAFMGKEDIPLKAVRYKYIGEVPSNAPAVPSSAQYAEGTKVGVAPNIEIEGYTFSGWQTSNVSVSNGSFTMPNTDVEFTGTFTKKEIPKSSVEYRIEGEMPNSYMLPLKKEYAIGSDVKVDVLKAGDVLNGYRFLGWTSNQVTVSTEGDFVMPSTPVVFVGKFESITYQVSYAFYDTVLPDNANKLLPNSSRYHPGDTVTLAPNPTAEGYEFLGWNRETTFTMPEENIIVYGEWKKKTGTFAPTITKENIGSNTHYMPGDKVPFKITVTNTSNFPIKNVLVKEENDPAFFTINSNYTIVSDHIANIDEIPALGKVELFAYYKVQIADTGTIENVVSIKGALADNHYELEDKEYVAQASLKVQSKLKICKEVTGVSLPNTFQFHITREGYDSWITLEKDECRTIYLEPGNYKIQEVVPQEYQIHQIRGDITMNNSILNVEDGKDYNITYINEFKKKGFLHSFGRVENHLMWRLEK